METLKKLLVLTCVMGIGVLSLSGVADLGRGFPNPYYVDGGLIFRGALKLLGAFILILVYWVWFWDDYPWFPE
jgi:hypothetical protein